MQIGINECPVSISAYGKLENVRTGHPLTNHQKLLIKLEKDRRRNEFIYQLLTKERLEKRAK